MAFQEAGTRILHDLGILDSNVQSPHRNKTIEDGNLQQTSKETNKIKDESAQRLIDDSRPIATDNNAQPRQSDTFYKEFMVYIFGLISILAVWFLITDITHMSNQLKIDNIYQLSWIPASLGVGIFIGSYLIIPLLLKVYALFIIQFFASFAVGIAILQYNYLNFSSLLFAMGFLGIAFGVIERFSYLYIHQVFQSSKRKVLFFYAVLAFGILFSNLIVWYSTVLPLNNNISNSDNNHIRIKHDAGLPAINLSLYNPENRMTTDAYRPTKPSSAIGISENQDTKTAENAEKRKLAEMKKESLANAINSTIDCFTNPNAENCTKMLFQTSTLASTTTTTTTASPLTSTSTIAIKKDSIIDGSNSESLLPSIDDPLDPIPRNRNRITKIPSKKEFSQTPKPNVSLPISKEPSSVTYLGSIILIFFLFPFNFAAFACNHFWCKETLLSISIAAESFKQPSFITRITSIILWFLSDFLTYGLFSLSPFIYASLFDKKINEFSFYYGILIWGLVFFKRIILYIFSDFAVSKRCMQILIFSSLCCSIILFVLTKSDLSFMVFLGIGITVSSLSILIALHQQATMNLSPYTTSGRYMLWSSMGRIFGPLIMGKILTNDSLEMLANFVFIIIIIMLIAFYYFTKNITTAARHQQLQDLTMDISSPQNNDNAAASSSSLTSTIKTRSTQYGTKYSLIEADDTDSLSNCLISDSEEDELLSLSR